MSAKLFWPGVVAGWLLIGIGLVGIAGEGRDVPIDGFGRWVVGLALVHDLVLVPIVVAVGVGLARALQPPWRAIAGATLIVAGPIVLFAWPYVAGWGRSAANPSIQPRDYGSGVVTLLAAIGVAAAALVLAEVVRRARAR